VLSSTVITNPRVPRLIRHSLNLESGLNDRLALPAVLALIAAAQQDGDFTWWEFVIQDVGRGVSAHQKGLYALGVASWPTARSPCLRRATASSPCS
jgi:hypothetical protein